ncbi:mediator of RNA polymerase II transcription subunit 1-like isoform X2 [Gigantopelta aegis]|nr:mediator of RNA polymerase II transcription subunit 1-like isoform X2 [Gigantopelta aegis]
MFHVAIIFDKGAGVKDVKIVHGSDAVSCPELTDVLIRRDFSGFIAHLEGLQHIYQISGDKKLKTKAFFALQSLEKDLNQLAQLQSSISGVGKYIHKSPLGILLPRKGGLPMKLIYFVSPYDLLDKSTKTAHPMTVEAITDNSLGQSVTVCLESGSSNKLQTMPLMTVINKDGKSLPNFVGLSSVNSHIFPASFVLVLPQPVPVAMSTIQKIQSVTSLEIPKGNDPKPLLSLILETFSSGKIFNEKQLFVSLPDQQHVYYLNSVNGGPLDLPGMMISKIPFTHPTHVATILNHLRQQLLFNAIISSCIRPHAKRDLASSVVLDLTAVSLQQVCIALEHPVHDCMVTVELDISDITNLKCRLLTSISDHQLCTDDFASRIFQRCMSIPITLRSIIKKGKEQLQKIAEERMAALKQAMWQRQKNQAAAAAAAAVLHTPVLPKSVPVSPVNAYPVNQLDQPNLTHPPVNQVPPPNHPRMMNHHGQQQQQQHPVSMHSPMNHQQHPGVVSQPLTHQTPMAKARFHSLGPHHMGQLHMDNVPEHMYPMRTGSNEMVSPPGDRTPSNPLLATLLDNVEGEPQPQPAPVVGTGSIEISESPMLSKLLEDNSSVVSSAACSGSSAIANASKTPSGPQKRVRKRRSTSDVFSGRSPKHRIGEIEVGDRLSTIDMESSCSPFDNYQASLGMTSNSGMGGSIIDLTEESFAESSLKKLADSVDSFIQKESRQGSNTESELTALLSDSDPGPPLSMSSRNSSPGSKNENASTSLEELLTGSGVGNEAEDPVFAGVDKGSNKGSFLGPRTSPSHAGTSPLSAMTSPSPIGFKTSPASLGSRSLTSPLRGKTPPLAAKTPPLRVKTPPTGVKTPPLGARTPPLVTKTPPLSVKTSPPLDIKQSPSPLHEYASKSQMDVQFQNELHGSTVKDRSNPLYKAILDGPELCDQDSNSSFKDCSKGMEVNSLSGSGRQITGIFEKFENLENFSRSEQFVEKCEKIEAMSSSILKSEEGKVKLKLSALRNSSGSFSDSFSKSQMKSSNVGTFDFKSDEDEDDPLPSLGSSDRLSVYAASPTRLQISNKPKNMIDSSILRKGEKYKRKDSKYTASGDSVKRKRKDESKKERKKRKNDKYSNVGNTVYHSTTVETDQKSITKLKIRVGKDIHVMVEANLSKSKKQFASVSDKMVSPKLEVEACDNLATLKSQSSQKSFHELSPEDASPIQTHGSTVTKTDPKLAKKTTIRLKPLNIPSSSITVQTENKQSGTPDKTPASIQSVLTLSKTLDDKTVPNAVKHDLSSTNLQEKASMQAVEVTKPATSELTTSRFSTSPSKRSNVSLNSSRDSPSVKSSQSSSSTKPSSESSKHSSSSDRVKPPTSLNLSKTSSTSMKKTPSSSNSPKLQGSVKTSSASKNPGTPNSSSKASLSLSSSATTASTASKTFSPVKNSPAPNASKSALSLKSSPSSGSSKTSSGSSKPSSGSHKATSLKFQSSGSPVKSVSGSKLGPGSSRGTSSLKPLSAVGKSQASSRSRSLNSKIPSTSSSSSTVGATISMATFLGAPSARSVASLPPIPKRSSSSGGGSGSSSGGATNISVAGSASHVTVLNCSSSQGNLGAGAVSSTSSTATAVSSVDSINMPLSSSGTFSSSADKAKQAAGGSGGGSAAARSRKGSLSAVIDKLTKSSTASVNVSSMAEKAAKGLSNENKSKDRTLSSGDSRNVCGKRSLGDVSGDRNPAKKTSKFTGFNNKMGTSESASLVSQYPSPHNKSVSSSDSSSLSAAHPNNVHSKFVGRTSPLTKVSPVNKENPATNASPKASSLALGKQSQKKNYTVKENSAIQMGTTGSSDKVERTGSSESAINKTAFSKDDVKRKEKRNSVDKVCSNSTTTALDLSAKHAFSVSNNKKKSGSDKVDKGSIKNRGSSPLTTKNIQNVNMERKSPVKKCSSPVVSVTTKFNGDSVKDKSKEEKEPFKVPTPTPKAPEVRDNEDPCNITPKKRVSVKSKQYNSKSPCSDPDSPENSLIIDCPTSPKQVHSNERSPDKKETVPVDSAAEELKHLTWKTVVPISPVHKVRQSPTTSPKTKVNSNPGSVANNSPCEIDDDLMDEALIGLGS